MITIQWGNARPVTKEIHLEQKAGKRSAYFEDPVTGERCDGSYNMTTDLTGTWAMSCPDGRSANGTFTAFGAGKGSEGEGRDNQGRVVKYTIAGR